MSATLSSSERTIDVRICTEHEIPPGLGRAFELRGARIAVFRARDGGVHACEDRCPHRGAPLSDGMLAGDTIVCPFHAFRYKLQTGECDQAGACALTTFPARVQDGWVTLTLVPALWGGDD
jgi:nitrite reductase (NADH) small subunit